MKEIAAYKTSDGLLFEDERKADAHQQDIIGECLDDLLADDGRGHVTRTDRFNMLLGTMKDPDLVRKVVALYKAVMHGREDE